MRMLTIALALLLSVLPAGAQTTPFDMTPERPAGTEAVGPPKPDTIAVAPAEVLDAAYRRYLVPFPDLILAGESAQRSWSVFLTSAQAETKATFHIGYQNAVIVAPELSRLTVTINGQPVVDAPIASSDAMSDLAVEVPPGLLVAGLNDIKITSEQRHRTDCTIQSTYELWAQIKAAETFLSFEGTGALLWSRAEDIRAIGVGEFGDTTFNIVAPAMDQSASTPSIVRISEALAILANMPNQSFVVSSGAPTEKPASGHATIVLGPAGTLGGVLKTLPPGAAMSPVAAMVDDPVLGPSTLVITGPDWPSVEAAVESIAKQVDRPTQAQRTTLATRSWHAPDVPMLFGKNRISFDDLGIATQEFSGRRLRSEFSVGIPSDFYADSYGQAVIQIDAAYSSDILPGSHIDVYVNDNIAATLPITNAGGAILRHLPIKVTMRHFRPGDNTIAVEAVLMTQDDAVCAPGATALDERRFVLFGSSEFVMPDFARIGRAPNLAAVSGTGFPYNWAVQPVPLIVDRTQPEALSAAVTLLARMSVAAGRLIPVDPSASVASVANRDALFVGPISQVAPAVLAQVGVAGDARLSWGDPVASIEPDKQVTLDDWRDRLSGGGLRERIISVEDWMGRTFNLSTQSFSLFAGPPGEYSPDGNANLMLAQQTGPGGQGVWTVLTAPSVGSLQDGMRALASQANWRQLGGRITTFDAIDTKVSSVSAAQFGFVETQPFSLANYRLIAANWLSSNAVFYAIALTAFSILLGLATAGLLGTLGRAK